MANVFDVAKYTVNKTGAIDTWKLQKLVYYCQAWSLVWDNQPIFNERIEAWANGPVCRELYTKHKGLYEVRPESKIWDSASIDILTSDEIDTMNAIIRDYGDMKGYELRALTHMEDPWLLARGDTPEMQACENEIIHESMRLYYGSL